MCVCVCVRACVREEEVEKRERWGECISVFDSFRFSESFCILFPPKGYFRQCALPEFVVYRRLFGYVNAAAVCVCVCVCVCVLTWWLLFAVHDVLMSFCSVDKRGREWSTGALNSWRLEVWSAHRHTQTQPGAAVLGQGLTAALLENTSGVWFVRFYWYILVKK